MTDQTDQPTPDELFAVLARELRTPLSTIEGYLELLNNGDVGLLLPEQREYLQVVGRNVHRLVAVVNDWTEMCKLEAGRLQIVRQDVDIEEVIDRAVAEVRPRIRAKEQRFHVRLPDEPVTVLGDARALTRVVDNLLSNAHKYTPPAGSIEVVVRADGEDWIRLDVIDTGIGLREEDKGKLFRKFFRSSLTEAEPGSGLGLPICQILVERMGGQISVESALGKGSTFSVRLPCGGRDRDGFAPPATPDGSPAAQEAPVPVACHSER
ncbi:MAG: HAMP domain-containing histidine kinase [Chloroflexi bacterium]|nr:HAMP domain-containing histidine kinase [Chloroflexota bacterium]